MPKRKEETFETKRRREKAEALLKNAHVEWSAPDLWSSFKISPNRFDVLPIIGPV